MWSSVRVTIDWRGPHPITDAFDSNSSPGLGADWPGIYLHVTRDDAAHVIASYVGKHQSSVIYRQTEHFANYCSGLYHLYDGSGNQTFKGGSPLPNNFETLLIDHIGRTEIYFGSLDKQPAHTWADYTESLLQRSPIWPSRGGRILNYSNAPPMYEMFGQMEVVHSGPGVQFFGARTAWDRATRTVT